MARLFDDAQSQYLENANAIVSAVPFSVSMWVYPDADLSMIFMSIADTAGDTNYFDLRMSATTLKAGISASDTGSGFSNAGATAALTLNQWNHIAGVFSAVDSRTIYLNGGNSNTDSHSRTPAGIDNTAIGALVRTGVAAATSGRIAEVGIYNVALTDDEIAELAKGASPLLVKPANLVAYWNLFGRSCPEPDIVGGFDMTLC
jgi:hypothetical protein